MPTWTFEGPYVWDVRPIVAYPPTRLMIRLAYGETVWRDAQGAWHQKYAPSPSELDGATAVYAGGRHHELTLAQRNALIAGGFGAYITQYPPDPIATVDLSVVDAANTA